MTRVRFAYPPSGFLTVDTLRVALANDLFRRSNNGTLLLRHDDLDQGRSKPGVPEQLRQDLQWCGVAWDREIQQSERVDLYQDIIARLQRDKFLYPCFETEAELRAKQEFRRRRHQKTIYDRAMLSLTPAQRASAEARGKRPHWRFKLSGRQLKWIDLIQGRRGADLSEVSDPILVHADGSPAPLLAGVIDDLETEITHVIRGEDSAANTAIQLELFEVLTGSSNAVRFGHLPVLVDVDTPGASFRRFGTWPVRTLRQDGVEAPAIVACLTGRDPAPLDQIAARIRLSDFSAASLDIERMLRINRSILRDLPFEDVADRLPSGATEAFWRATRGSLDILKEARGWWEAVAGTIIPPVIEDAHELLAKAVELLPPEPWDHDVCEHWLRAVIAATDLQEDEVVHIMRLALTGEDFGPDLADLLPLIGRSRAAARLGVAAA